MARAQPPVDLTPDLWMLKLILGAIDPSYDTKDEKQNMGGAPSGMPPAGQYGAPPSQSYGAPPNQGYGAPPQGYGAPMGQAPYGQQQQYPPPAGRGGYPGAQGSGYPPQQQGGYGQPPPRY